MQDNREREGGEGRSEQEQVPRMRGKKTTLHRADKEKEMRGEGGKLTKDNKRGGLKSFTYIFSGGNQSEKAASPENGEGVPRGGKG